MVSQIQITAWTLSILLVSLLAACRAGDARPAPNINSVDVTNSVGITSTPVIDRRRTGNLNRNERVGERPAAALPTAPTQPTPIKIPTFEPASLPPIGNEPARRLDPRLDELGVDVERPAIESGETYWRAVEVQWRNPRQAAGRHYVWVSTRSEQGQPVAGLPVIFKWASGYSSGPTPIDFPMYAGGHSYAVWIDDASTGVPSERVTGMGLGIPTSRFATDHVEYFITFQRAVKP